MEEKVDIEKTAETYCTEDRDNLNIFSSTNDESKNDFYVMELFCEIDDILTYAVVHNGVNFVRDICLKNSSNVDIDHVVLKIETKNDLIENFELNIEKIKSGEEFHLKNLKVSVNMNYLVSLTERCTCNLNIKVCKDEEEIISKTKELTVLAFDQWPGLQYTPELLAAFVTPNHPVVTSILQLATKYLNTWTNDPSLDGYQFHDPNRVKLMAAAVYAAIQQKNIIYVEPPSSFEACGQRIRLADVVYEQHMGTCMDLTLLYVACLEAMGLNPFMVMMNGHVFAGVWLVEQSFPDTIMDDPSQLEKRMSKGIHEMIVVECTAMCAGKTYSFDEANILAQKYVSNYDKFEFAVDVRRARTIGIRPLPIRIKTDFGFEVQHEEREKKEITNAPKAIGDVFDLSNIKVKETITKQVQWEHKLLDLSKHNMLINLRITKAVIPLLFADVSLLEDALADGEEFRVLSRPMDMVISQEDSALIETLGKLELFKDFITLEWKHKRLHSVYTEKELERCLTKIYRSAKSSMEENGASTVYLALGLLRWFDTKQSSIPRYAPIVLIPVDIIRKSASQGYTMRMRDEDVQLNVTLLEFLRQSYDIQIYGLNPVPMDEHGINISKIFAIIRDAVMNFSKWNVIESGFIGNFSFSQFVMWNDIHGKRDFLEKNKIVRSLINGAIDWNCMISDCVNADRDDAYLPVTVDSSQLRAINMATEGVSFILHGPPGTGKSQTITAMIANALTKGKTVLFVAEKMAALEVVQKRLASLGIQDFCLELHSNKSTKKAVLDQLKRGLDIGVWGIQTKYNEKIHEIRNMKAGLDAYVKALHTKREFGKSLYQLIDSYETIPEWGIDVEWNSDCIDEMKEYDLEHQIHRLERLVAAGKAVGHPHNHPLAAVYQNKYSQRLKFDLESIIRDYKNVLEKYDTDISNFVHLMNVGMPVSEKEWKEIYNDAYSLFAMEEIPSFLRNADSLQEEFYVPKNYIAKRDAFTAKQAEFKRLWNENFLKLDMNSFRVKYDKANSKFFGKRKALDIITSEIQAYASFRVETDKIPMYLTDISFYQQAVKEFEVVTEQVPLVWKEILQIYHTKSDLEEYEAKITKHMDNMASFASQICALESAGKLKNGIELAGIIVQDMTDLIKKEKAASELLELKFSEGEENWMDYRLSMCRCIIENTSSIRDWIAYRNIEKECAEHGLLPICSVYESGVTHDHIVDVYLRSIYKAIILSVIEKEPVLNNFTGAGFEEQIAQFKKMDQAFMELTKDEMFYKLTHNLPTHYHSVQISKELNILRRAISSNGRGISIRSLFEQIPTVLTKLCPCMLMSPISVAQYLSAENDMFDIVIFDEASQLPTCKAVGVLARGKNAVIVGDPNQMPPTSFFAGNRVDEDNLDMEDLDSILDDCLALGMPQTHLHWHYRSRHESLIAFSNQEFYENSMFTFPSMNDGEKRVKLVKVKGIFERGKGRVNREEAKAIVDEIKRRYADPVLTLKTIGVVTFNISQQTLIEDLLQEEYQQDPVFDKWANGGDETVFVKNLENVQGDERDIILFSVAFGPDSEGNLSLNFGPLNRENGWKRLNVAITRARSEMLVFTTMTSDLIELKRTKSKGVESLKHFLEYAEKGELQAQSAERREQKEQGITNRICECISEAGYKYRKSVGRSKFKVDIAVINPFNEEEYLLGIMLDGESYKQSVNTKDREIGQISILHGLGWNLHRIWTMDWWENREKELSKLLARMEELRKIAEECYKKQNINEDSSEAINITEGETKPAVRISLAETEQKIDGVTTISTEMEKIETQSSSIMASLTEDQEESFTKFDFKNSYNERKYFDNLEVKIALKGKQDTDPIEKIVCKDVYSAVEYKGAQVDSFHMSTSEFVQKQSISLIVEKMQKIIDVEAPIHYDCLMRKTLRAFEISRSSAQTLEAADKAFKKVLAKLNKQTGGRFVWKEDQNQDEYRIFRIDQGTENKRNADEICQQELKNAVCFTLQKNGTMDKERLIKETIRTMGYVRSGAALVSAVEKGITYGLKTGEIMLNKENELELSNSINSINT